MTDITTFPAIQDVLVSGDNVHEYTATEDITKGQVVGFAATGVSNAVVPLDATAGEQPIGVAVSTAAAGAIVQVAKDGCVVKVANYDDTEVSDAGDYMEINDCGVKGTVNTLALTQFTANHYVVGILEADLAASGTANMMVQVGVQVDSTT